MSATGERYGDGRMSYRCDKCGLVGPWGPNWMWFGSYLEAENGERVATFCSDGCRPAGVVPDDVEVLPRRRR